MVSSISISVSIPYIFVYTGSLLEGEISTLNKPALAVPTSIPESPVFCIKPLTAFNSFIVPPLLSVCAINSPPTIWFTWPAVCPALARPLYA